MANRSLDAGNTDAPSKAFGLLAQAEFKAPIQVRAGYFEHLILLDGGPYGADIGISADHGEQLELTVATVSRHLSNRSSSSTA